MRRLDSLKIINNLLDYLIHINDTNLKQKTLSALKHYALNKHTGFDAEKHIHKVSLILIDSLQQQVSKDIQYTIIEN